MIPIIPAKIAAMIVDLNLTCKGECQRINSFNPSRKKITSAQSLKNTKSNMICPLFRRPQVRGDFTALRTSFCATTISSLRKSSMIMEGNCKTRCRLGG
jgi:hypothetical protein